MSTLQLPTGVGLTALITAYARAQETRAARPVFVDPVAELFVTEVLGLAPGSKGALPRLGPARDDGSSALWNSLYAYFSGRTPFYDQFLCGAVAAGRRQVVLLGAGLDTRAIRLALETGTTVYEIDTPAVLSFKNSVLQKHDVRSPVTRISVALDLRRDWLTELAGAGFDPEQPTAWLAEGLLMYLTPREADAMLAVITAASAQGSVLAGEYLNRRTRLDDVPLSDQGDRLVADLFVGADRGGPETEPAKWIATHGWLGHQLDFADELARLGRSLPALFDPSKPEPLRLWLFTASLPGQRN